MNVISIHWLHSLPDNVLVFQEDEKIVELKYS